MDRDSVCVCLLMMTCAPAIALGSGADNDACPCPQIRHWPLTESPPPDCYQVNATFRYTCTQGYVREAGTSNRIKCKKDDAGDIRWSTPSLLCKPDPNRATTPPPNPLGTREAPPSSPKMTRSPGGSPSPKPSTTEPNLPGPQGRSDHTQGGAMVAGPVAQTASPSSSNQTGRGSNTAAVAGSSVAAAVICALLISLVACYKWRATRINRSTTATNDGTAEEMAPINNTPP